MFDNAISPWGEGNLWLGLLLASFGVLPVTATEDIAIASDATRAAGW
jgi:hypothetical protein